MGILDINSSVPPEGSMADFSLNDLIAVGTASVVILKAFKRVEFALYNSSAASQALTLHMGFGTAKLNVGMVLKAGQTLIGSSDGNRLCFQGVITAIATAPAGQISIYAR